MKEKTLQQRLSDIENNYGFSQPEMGLLLNVSARTYQRYLDGEFPEGGKLTKLKRRIAELEKEKDLSKYLKGVHDNAPVRAGAKNDQTDFLISENQTLSMEVTSLKKQVTTLLTQIDFLYEQLKEKTAALETYSQRRN